MKKKTIRDIDVSGKRVLVRVDYNVPVKAGEVGDTLRIQASFETLNYLLERKCSLVLISHLGEPKDGPDPQFSLKSVAAKASELLGRPIKFVEDCVGAEVQKAAEGLREGDIMLCENLRFHAGETKNDPDFAKQLSQLGEIFVNDAFAAEHREHASIVGVPKYLPAVAGLLLEKEVDTITAALDNPKRPLFAAIGGSKISTKIDILTNLIKRVDILLIGGAMANTFLASEGYEIGKSLVEKDQIPTADSIIKEAEKAGIDLIVPLDVVVSKTADKPEKVRTVGVMDVDDDDIIVDVGPETIDRATKPLSLAGTIIWNGPLGITEIDEFSEGSKLLAKKIADANAESVIGGGDTAAYIDHIGMHNKFSFVSTGGGAALELMAGRPLPGVEALLAK